MRRTVKVMADHECSPLWSEPPDEPGDLDPGGLVSAELAAELMAWAGRYDATLDRQDPRESGFPDEEAHRRFVEDGELLARRVAGELGDGWRVLYVDDRTSTVSTVQP